MPRIAMLVLLSGVLKVALSLDAFYNGFLVRDFRAINNDSLGYVERAAGRAQGLGESNFLWDVLNSAMLSVLGDDRYLFLAMALLNVGLSLALPFAFLPALRRLVPRDKWQVAAPIMVGVMLFWPPAIYMAAQNMKDTLLTVAVAVCVSAVTVLGDRSTSGPMRAAVVVLLLVAAWVTLATRMYAAVLLFSAVLVTYLAPAAHRGRRLLAVVALVSAGLFSPLGQSILLWLKFGWQLLFDLDFREAVNVDLALSNTAPLGLNVTPAAIVLGLGRAPLNPFPGPNISTWYDAALMLRTVVVALVFPGFLIALTRWRHERQRTFYLAYFVIAWAFFAVFSGLNGARQVFSTVEPPFVMLAVALFVQRTESRSWRIGAACGALLAGLLFVYTAVRTFTMEG